MQALQQNRAAGPAAAQPAGLRQGPVAAVAAAPRQRLALRQRQQQQQQLVQQQPWQQRQSQQCRRGSLAVTASAAGAGALNPEEPTAAQKIVAFKEAFWKFLRPHTIRGTILGSTAVTTIALLENTGLIDWALLPRAALGVLALLCGNGYIVGINQIYDVEIDAVNKPFLPVAAGELSQGAAWALCLLLAAGGVAITSLNFGPLITGLYCFGLFLGTIYSVPPLRLKRSAIAAFMIIATVRGFLLNFGVYHAARAALGLPFAWNPSITFITAFVMPPASPAGLSSVLMTCAASHSSPQLHHRVCHAVCQPAGPVVFLLLAHECLSSPCVPTRSFITAFVTLFATVIAITKDLPDIEGDKQFGIETFATRMGVRNIAFLGSGLLVANYVGAIAAALRFPALFNIWTMGAGHAVLAVVLIYKTIKLDAAHYSQQAIKDYYGAIWLNFYCEYLLLPFLAWGI